VNLKQTRRRKEIATIPDADPPASVPHLNRRNYFGIRLWVPRIEGMPFAQMLHWLTETHKKTAPTGARAE
jgi:hypothetical protein